MLKKYYDESLKKLIEDGYNHYISYDPKVDRSGRVSVGASFFKKDIGKPILKSFALDNQSEFNKLKKTLKSDFVQRNVKEDYLSKRNTGIFTDRAAGYDAVYIKSEENFTDEVTEHRIYFYNEKNKLKPASFKTKGNLTSKDTEEFLKLFKEGFFHLTDMITKIGSEEKIELSQWREKQRLTNKYQKSPDNIKSNERS